MATSTDLRAAIDEVQQSLPEEQIVVPGDLGELYQQGALDRFAKRVGALPWWVISATVHSVIFLLATLLTVAVPPAQVDEVLISTDVVKREEPKLEENVKRDIFKKTTEIQHDTKVDKPVVVHEEAEVTDHFETQNDMDMHTAAGQEDAISDIPLGGTGVTGSMGVGGGGMAGCFGYRGGGGRKRAVGRFGGSEKTESAVEAALAWLARHQENDGRWDARKLEGGGQYDGAMTGLAALAFLGAGYTSKNGKYRDNVRRAVDWMVRDQNDDGSFKSDRLCHMYGHGMITLALSEAYGMSKEARVGEAAQKAVDYIVAAQGPYEAWNYNHKKGQRGRNDTSVTGWQVMALKSAKVAGLKVEMGAFQGATNWLERAILRQPKYDHIGWCAYAGTINDAPKGTGSPAMAAAGMIMRQFMGVPRGDPLMQGTAKLITESKYMQPKWPDAKVNGVGYGTGNFYYWYYATLAMFQMGGDHWEKWNKKLLLGILVPNQRNGGPRDGSANDVDGSWDPNGGGGVGRGGRVMSTALGALSLEVYYRYLPLYGK